MISEERKKQLQDENKEKSRRQDNKQHCQKILQGIGKFDNNSANRAIWELIQNARDLSEHSHMRIVLDKEKLLFAHNGKPFNYETFSSLVKQVSSEEKEDPNAAGQFGTGFMTTHKFSRIIEIDGSLKVDEDEYAPFEGFVLDRSATDISPMIIAMTNQLKELDRIYDKTPTVHEPKDWTSFTYRLDDAHRPAAEQGVDSAFELMAYVMTINERIKEVILEDTIHQKRVCYVKFPQPDIDGNCHLKHMMIKANDEDQHCYYLQSENKKDIIILPLDTETQTKTIDGVAKLFIFFPLLGTENFGFNFLFHSERFYPTEPRDGIELPHNNLDGQKKYAYDEHVMNDMLDMLFGYLELHGGEIKDARRIASVKINPNTHEDEEERRFYQCLKNRLVSKYLTIPFLQIGKERTSVNQSDKVRFLAPEIVEYLQTEEGYAYLDVVYEYAQTVSALPAKEECLEWSEIVAEWDETATERFVTVENIVDKITEGETIDQLHKFLLFLRESGQTTYFQTKALIPNREGIRKASVNLRNAADIPVELYDVSKMLIPTDTEKFVDTGYADICELTEYKRDDLKKSINDYVNAQKITQEPFKDHVADIIKYCSIYPVQNGIAIRNKVMPYFCQLLNQEYHEMYVEPLVESDKEQDLYRTAFDVLVEYMVKQIADTATKDITWFEKNNELHYNIIFALSNKERTTTYQKEVLPRYAVIPNQLGILCLKEHLRVLNGRHVIPIEDQNDLFDCYKEVVGHDLHTIWVEERYVDFLTFDAVDPKSKAVEIDEALKEGEYKNPVIIEIIDHLDKDEKDGYWRKWFDNIETNKPNIFINRLKGKQRDYAYKFMRADEKRMELATELMDNPKMEELLNKAKEILEQEHDKQCQFNHLLLIGKNIEDRLRKQLDKSLLEVEHRKNMDEDMTVNDIQNGQDIIIRYKGKDIFYIEVKSKWNFDRPAHMSTNQMRMAVLNPNCYALCCVDLTIYNSSSLENVSDQVILENTYVHLNIGGELNPLLGVIVRDNRSENESIKITDYQSNMTKKVFMNGSHFDTLIEAVVNAANRI